MTVSIKFGPAGSPWKSAGDPPGHDNVVTAMFGYETDTPELGLFYYEAGQWKTAFGMASVDQEVYTVFVWAEIRDVTTENIGRLIEVYDATSGLVGQDMIDEMLEMLS